MQQSDDTSMFRIRVNLYRVVAIADSATIRLFPEINIEHLSALALLLSCTVSIAGCCLTVVITYLVFLEFFSDPLGIRSFLVLFDSKYGFSYNIVLLYIGLLDVVF